MKTEKKALLTTVSVLLACPAYLLIFEKNLSAVRLSDLYFLIALLFLIIATGLLIFASGSFDHFQESFHSLKKRRKQDFETEFTPYSKIAKGKSKLWFETGIAILIASLFLLFF